MRRWYRAGAAVLILCAAVVGPATAQDKPRLHNRGVAGQWFINGRCGLSQGGFDTTLNLALRNSGFSDKEDRYRTDKPPSAEVQAIVWVQFLKGSNQCAASIALEIVRTDIVVPKGEGFAVRRAEKEFGLGEKLVLCRLGYLFVADEPDAGPLFSGIISSYLKSCLEMLEH